MNSDDVTSVLSSWGRADRSSDGGPFRRRLTELLGGDQERARSMIYMTDDLLEHLWSAAALTERIREMSAGQAVRITSLGAGVAIVAAALRDTAETWPPGTDTAWRHACNLIEQATHPDESTPFLPASGATDIATRRANDGGAR